MHYAFNFWTTLILIAVLMGVLQGTCAYLILLERKISAWAQDRIGPNRVGPFGLLQPIADGLKFLLKEEVVPHHVDKLFYMIAPAIAVGTATMAIVVVPFGETTAPPTYKWPQTVQEAEAARKEVVRREALPDGTVKETTREEDLAAYNSTVQFVIAP